MVLMHEVIIDYTAPNTQGGLSILYFAGVEDPDIVTGTINTALFTTAGTRAPGTTARVRTDGRVIESESGLLSGFWTAPPRAVVNGSDTGEPVGNASQVLLRLNTNVIIAGRAVKGRIFIPSLGAGRTLGGEVTAATQEGIAAAWQPLADLGAGGTWVVWARPFPGNPDTLAPAREGFAATVQSCSVWNELAIQRRRR